MLFYSLNQMVTKRAIGELRPPISQHNLLICSSPKYKGFFLGPCYTLPPSFLTIRQVCFQLTYKQTARDVTPQPSLSMLMVVFLFFGAGLQPRKPRRSPTTQIWFPEVFVIWGDADVLHWNNKWGSFLGCPGECVTVSVNLWLLM